MIEDKDVKIAETPIEALWTQVKEKAEKDIRTAKIEIEINKAVIELAEKSLTLLN